MKRSAKAEPLIGVVMGSDSDWPTLQAAARILQDFGVPYEARVVSAHRTPDLMFDYAESAQGRGLRAIIAGAGGAAHLPGMLAAKTPYPYWVCRCSRRPCRARIRCCPSCRCPRAFPSPPSPSARRAPPMPGYLRSRCWLQPTTNCRRSWPNFARRKPRRSCQ